MNEVATHVAPAWGRKANFLLRADLSGFGMPNRSEQLWARQITDRTFEICCLPFFTYGIALGDTVETNDEFTLQCVLRKSGHKTLRLAIGNKGQLAELHQRIHRWLDFNDLLYEWYATGYVSIDLTSLAHQVILVQFLQELGTSDDFSYEIDE